MSAQCHESAPWADTMKSDEREGHGAGEGCPPIDRWTVFDWDNYDAGCVLHAHIMVVYQLITYTRVSMARRGNAKVADEVINLLQTTLDNLTAVRETVRMGRMF